MQTLKERSLPATSGTSDASAARARAIALFPACGRDLGLFPTRPRLRDVPRSARSQARRGWAEIAAIAIASASIATSLFTVIGWLCD
jgi:hypothetical protein